MDAKSKTALIIAAAVAASLLLLFGPGTMTGTMMSDGMMAGGGVGMGGINWAWTSALLVGAMGVVLFFVVFRNNK
jgi:hypothetical protein